MFNRKPKIKHPKIYTWVWAQKGSIGYDLHISYTWFKHAFGKSDHSFSLGNLKEVDAKIKMVAKDHYEAWEHHKKDEEERARLEGCFHVFPNSFNYFEHPEYKKIKKVLIISKPSD